MCDAEALPSSGVNTTTIGGSASSSNVVFIVIWKSIAAGGGGSARVRANDGAGTEAGHVRSTSRVTSPVPFGNQKQNWRVRSLISSLRAAQVPRRCWSEWSARVEKASTVEIDWPTAAALTLVRCRPRAPIGDPTRPRRSTRRVPERGSARMRSDRLRGLARSEDGQAAAVLFYGGSPIST